MGISYATLNTEAAEALKSFKRKDFAGVEEGIFACGVEYLKKYAIQRHETKFYAYLSQMDKEVEAVEQVEDVIIVKSKTKSKISDEVIAKNYPGVVFTKEGKKTATECIQEKLYNEELETF